MPDAVRNVLFLCTGNTARSILAESLLGTLGAGRFRAHSAGSQPKGTVNPYAVRVLQASGFRTDGLRSKSWTEFAEPDAPPMDVIITVCDNAAGESCPIWPGRPATAHWGIEDPAAVEGSDGDKERAFVEAFRLMRDRIEAFLSLPLDQLDDAALRQRLQAIGRMSGASAQAAGTAPR